MKKTKITIKSQLIVSFVLIIASFAVLNIVLIRSLKFYNREYSGATFRLSTVNEITPIVREELNLEAYYLVIGRASDPTKLQELLDKSDEKINKLATSSPYLKLENQVEIIRKTFGTLKKYCDNLVEKLDTGDSYESRNATLEDIRDISAMVDILLSNYISLEIDYMTGLTKELDQKVAQLFITNIVALSCMVFLSILMVINVVGNITKPINQLITQMEQVGKGNFSAIEQEDSPNELSQLNTHFNRLVKKLDFLMEQDTKQAVQIEQGKLRLLQEQINPHFLYNTLETIIWASESGKKEETVKLVKALSKFFRLVLNQGKSNVTLQEEFETIGSYLEIQQIRYEDILSYELNLPTELLGYTIPKLTLQPIVENALYHGIKNKRGLNSIVVSAEEKGELLEITVEDTGIGMNENTLNKVVETLAKPLTSNSTSVGLYNIHQRLQLEYGKGYGLSISGSYGVGTKVIVRIPKISQ